MSDQYPIGGVALRPSRPADQRSGKGACYFSLFDAASAPLICSWVRTEQELTWLAPGTAPPLTPEKVLAWAKPGDRRLTYWEPGQSGPTAYAELNNMTGRPDQMWIGHFLVDPAHRGRYCGTQFAQALLAYAFLKYGARDVLLVVFPDNTAAIRCYQRAGMSAMGYERKHFEATGKEHIFLRMGMSAGCYRQMARAGSAPANALLLQRAGLTIQRSLSAPMVDGR